MSAHWSRPKVPNEVLEDKSMDLAFQMIDVDYIQEEEGVRIRLFGTTTDGQSICLSAKTYVPYFYMEAPKNHKTSNLSIYVNALNERLMQLGESQRRQYAPAGVTKFVLSVEEVRGKNLMHFQKEDQTLLKINVISPKVITACRSAFCQATNSSLTCFEANIDFETRFMADLNMVGCCWIQVLAKKYRIVHLSKKETLCQIEAATSIENMIVHPPEDPWDGIAPLRTMSFDIEVAGRPGIFPEAKQDPVIQIACVSKAEGAAEPFSRICFVLGGCNPVKGREIVSCKTEEELLKKFSDYFRTVDPDIVTGYNVQNFDIPYVLDRAKILKVEQYVSKFGRVRDQISKVREATLSSAQMGTRTNKITTIDGRIVFDVFQVIQREYKLRSYTLNNVSYHFLGEQKEDVAHQMITGLFNGSDQDRRRLAVYCLKDADLPLRLMEKLMLIINYIEMARVTGVPINFLIERGQQVKILSQLLRKVRSWLF
uniref:DNA polymerase delta catalytic subunit n=1 Tax=Bursaphelenchus xylophilus TaxID=6326 RepID=A0A1I7RME4_BURXY